MFALAEEDSWNLNKEKKKFEMKEGKNIKSAKPQITKFTSFSSIINSSYSFKSHAS